MPLVGELVRNNINQGREEDAKMLPCPFNCEISKANSARK